MKKNLPNIIILLFLSVSSGLLIFLYRSFGLGLFLKSFGIFMLIAGILVFIFFLSIDPGYAWSKTVNFNANYIAISAAVFICIAGSLLFFLGREIHDTTIQKASEMTRCRDLLNGHVGETIGKEWYFLSDRKDEKDLSLYLFQKRGEAEKFKIIAIDSSPGNTERVREIRVNSVYGLSPVVMVAEDGVCSGIFEAEILTHRPENLKVDSKVSFDVLVAYNEKEKRAAGGGKKIQLNFQLESDFCLR